MTKNQVKQKLDALYAAGDFNQETAPLYFKTGFDTDPVFSDHNWVVFYILTANVLPSAQFDFDENVVWESKLDASGIFAATLIVAGSAKPEPSVESGVNYPTVVGQWDFNEGDLTATVGQDLVSVGGQEIFGILGGAPLMLVPPSTEGLMMRHGAAPNGGPSAARLNQWTLIMDLLVSTNHGIGDSSLIKIDTLDNSTSGDLFIKMLDSGAGLVGAIGVDGNYNVNDSLTPGTLHRVAITVDTTREQVMSKYIDGDLVGEQPIRTFNATPAGPAYSYSADRWSLMDTALLFGDNKDAAGNLLVSSIQLRNYKMSAAEVAALGGAITAGIPNETMTLSAEWADGPGLDTSKDFERMDKTLLKNQFKLSWNPIYQLQQSNSPGGPWVDVPTTEGTRFFNTEGMTRKFFQIRSR